MKQLTRIYHNYFDTYLLGYNEKYRYIFLQACTLFMVYSLKTKSIILETREFKWVETITFTDDMEYMVLTSYKTNKSQQFDGFLIQLMTLEKGLEYTHLGKVNDRTVLTTSRFPNSVIMGRRNNIEIYDCVEKKTILELKRRGSFTNGFHMIEGQESDLIRVSYYSVSSKEEEYYKITQSSIEKWKDDRNQHWEQYSQNRKIHKMSFLDNKGVKIDDRINDRKIIFYNKRVSFSQGNISLSGNYYISCLLRAMKSLVYNSEVLGYYIEGDFAGYLTLFDLRTKQVECIFPFSVAGKYYFDEKEKIVVFGASGPHCDIRICQLEEKDFINKNLEEIDYEFLQLAFDVTNSELLRLKNH